MVRQRVLLLACALGLLAGRPVTAQPARCQAAYGNGVPRTVSSACWPDGALPKTCSPSCAAVFNPFWSVCRPTIMANAKSTSREGLKPFSDRCKAATIGHKGGRRACANKEAYSKRKAAMMKVCCTGKNCIRGLPRKCGLTCAVEFSSYYEDCLSQIGAANTAYETRRTDQKYRKCIDEQDPSEVLAVLSDMKSEGCVVSTNDAVSIESEAKFHGMHGGQVWAGHYLCGQGDTDLQVKVGEVTAGGVIHATFAFDHKKQCSGEYRVSGKIDKDGNLALKPQKAGSSTEGWISNPCHYVSVGMSGKVSQGVGGELMYAGKISSSGCGQFLVTLPSAKPGELSCPDTAAGWQKAATMCYVKVEKKLSLLQERHAMPPS